VYDDGRGPALYAGGASTRCGRRRGEQIAKWDGSRWSALGSGLDRHVFGLAVYDDGGGPALYAAGYLHERGDLPANRIAKMGRLELVPLGSGTDSTVSSLAVYDDGGGPALYAAGYFTSAGGPAGEPDREMGRLELVAPRQRGGWSPLPSSRPWRCTTTAPAGALRRRLLRDGGGVVAHGIAKWDGSSWSAWEAGWTTVSRLSRSTTDGGGPALYVGGDFRYATDYGDSYLAKWGCADSERPRALLSRVHRVLDRLLDGPGEVVSFTVTATDDLDPSPVVVCVPPSGSTFPRGTTRVVCTANDASGNGPRASSR
jgi:hypothetical protein